MIEWARHFIGEGHALSVVLLCAVAVILEVGLIVLAALRKNKLVPLLAIVVFVLPLVAAGATFREALATFLSGTSSAEPYGKATLLAGAISAQLITGNVLCWGMLPVTCGAGISALLSFERNRVARAAVVIAMLSAGVLLAGGIQFCADVTLGFANTVVGPEERAEFLRQHLDQSLSAFRTLTIVAGVGLVGAMGVGFAAFRSVQARFTMLTPVCLSIGALLIAEAWPFFVENSVPLPFSATGDVILPMPEIQTPDLVGPDAVERAPIIGVGVGALTIDGAPTDVRGIEDRLTEIKKTDEMMHPGEPFQGGVVLVVDQRVEGKVLVEVVGACLGADYRRGTFAFVRSGQIERPTVGPIPWSKTSGAKFELVKESDVRIVLADRFKEIAERVVAARKENKTVFVSTLCH